MTLWWNLESVGEPKIFPVHSDSDQSWLILTKVKADLEVNEDDDKSQLSVAYIHKVQHSYVLISIGRAMMSLWVMPLSLTCGNAECVQSQNVGEKCWFFCLLMFLFSRPSAHRPTPLNWWMEASSGRTTRLGRGRTCSTTMSTMDGSRKPCAQKPTWSTGHIVSRCKTMFILRSRRSHQEVGNDLFTILVYLKSNPFALNSSSIPITVRIWLFAKPPATELNLPRWQCLTTTPTGGWQGWWP